MKVYVMISKDKFEFPLIIANSQAELARKVGVNSSSINRSIYNSKRGAKSRYIEVEIDDD